MELKERFLKYVGFDTQSDPESETYPSTAKQLILLNYLAEEMKELGLEDVEVDANVAYVDLIQGTVRKSRVSELLHIAEEIAQVQIIFINGFLRMGFHRFVVRQKLQQDLRRVRSVIHGHDIAPHL